MRRLLGDDADELVSALQLPSEVGLRVNARKAEPEAVATALPWTLRPVPWAPTGYVAHDPPDRPGRHPWHLAGVYYVQDPSAMAVAEAARVRPGMWVADLAAAPGGKATRLSELAGPRGLLLANDVQPDRAVALGQNLERWGADNAILTRAEIADLADAWGPVFDRVVLDAPCSGEGMFRKSSEARDQWSEATVAACAVRQDELLGQAARMVAPGGKLIYSTCTFAPEENEGVVAAFLVRHPAFTVEPVGLADASPGRPDWVPSGAPDALAGAGRWWPHRQRGEGHFVALLSKRGGDDGLRRPAAAPSDLDRAAAELLAGFADASLVDVPWRGRALARVGDDVYARPDGAPDVSAGSLIRPGWWLGTLKTKRFEPSHALALGLRAPQVQRTIDLGRDDRRLAAYLTGLELEDAGDDGWLVVCVDGFPIGWGRRVRGVVRNAYPKGLRLR